MEESSGGSAANVARGAAALARARARRLGQATRVPNGDADDHLQQCVAFAGKVGRDARGAAYAAALHARGVAPLLAESQSTPTGVCVALVDGASGQRTMRPFLGAAAEMRAEDFERVAGEALKCGACRLLAIEGYQLWKVGLTEAAAAAARAAGAAVALDLASWELVRARGAQIAALLDAGALDVLLMNEDEAEEILVVKAAGDEDVGAEDAAAKEAAALARDEGAADGDVSAALRGKLAIAARALRRATCAPGRARVASVSLGADGCAVRARGGACARVRAPHANCIDTTGAGDSFAAAFLWELLENGALDTDGPIDSGGADLQRAVEAAATAGCAAGAAAVAAVGAELPDVTWAQVEAEAAVRRGRPTSDGTI